MTPMHALRSLPLCLVLFAVLASPVVAVDPVQKPASAGQTAGPVQKPGTVIQAECPPFPRPQDEVWLISSRHLCWSEVDAKTKPPAAQLSYERLIADEWKPQTLDAYVASEEKAKRTIMFVHGFWTDAWEAHSKGEMVFRALLDEEANKEPHRLVIWSWPSDRNRRNRISQDAREKAWRSDFDGMLLASLINQSKTERPVSILGYSLGARAMFGALHLLDGGTYEDHRVSATPTVKKIPIRVVTMAAALHNYWLDPGQRFSKALDRAENTVLLNNQCDRALKWYPRAFGRNRRCGPEALGRVGLYAEGLSPKVRGKFEQFDVCCYVGRQHQIRDYVAWVDLIKKMQVGAFGNSSP